MSAPKKQHVPSEADKEKMQLGAKAMRAVDKYLQHINSPLKPKGRPVNMATLEAKIREETNLAKKTILIAQMHRAIEWENKQAEGAALEDDFVKHVLWFSEQHNIDYATWREMEVSPAVLKKAGITS